MADTDLDGTPITFVLGYPPSYHAYWTYHPGMLKAGGGPEYVVPEAKLNPSQIARAKAESVDPFKRSPASGTTSWLVAGAVAIGAFFLLKRMRK